MLVKTGNELTAAIATHIREICEDVKCDKFTFSFKEGFTATYHLQEDRWSIGATKEFLKTWGIS